MRETFQAPLLIRAYAFLLRRIPLASGTTRLAFNRVVNPLFARCRGTLLAQMRNGIRIEIDPDEYHGRILYLFGTNDPKVHATTQALLCPGDSFLDIGANYSTIGLAAADKVGPDGAVHLFEPQPWLCERLERAIALSGQTNVKLHQFGLMDRNDELKLSRPPNHSGMATFVEHCDMKDWTSVTVPVRAVSEVLAPLLGERPFGVKVDVEGAEPYILPWLLAQPRLRFLVFEAAHNQQALFDAVRSAGLTLYGLRRLVLRKRLGLVEDFSQMEAYHDLVAVRLPAGTTPPGSIRPTDLATRIQRVEA